MEKRKFVNINHSRLSLDFNTNLYYENHFLLCINRKILHIHYGPTIHKKYV